MALYKAFSVTVCFYYATFSLNNNNFDHVCISSSNIIDRTSEMSLQTSREVILTVLTHVGACHMERIAGIAIVVW
jgi:hypothetical protein